MFAIKSLNEFKSLVLFSVAFIIILSILPFLFWNTTLSSPYMNILTSITSLLAFIFLIYGTWWSLKNHKNIFKPLFIFTCGAGLYFTVNLLYLINEEIMSIFFPISIVDTLFLACYPLLIIGIILFHNKPFEIRYKELLDIVIIIVSLFFIVWFPFIWPVVEPTRPDTLSMLSSLLYLFLDILLLSAALILLFNKNRKIHELPIILLSLGIVFQIYGDMAYAYYVIYPVLAYKWLFSVLYTTNSIFIILAVTSFINKINIDVRQLIHSYRKTNAKNDWISYFPLLLVLCAYGLLIITKPDAALIWGVGIIVVLVILRQIISLNEIRKAQIEQEKAEIVIIKSLNEKETLLREIHHRVKNNLQVILSLLSLQSENVVNKKDQEIFRESQNQVRSLALIHEKLYESDNLSSINFSDYLKTLLESLIYEYPHDLSQISLELDVEEIELNIETSVPCGLIINELVFNSLKNAFPLGSKGTLSIKMYSENDEYILSVAADGSGYVRDTGIQNITNRGLNLVDALVKQLDGTLEIIGGKGTVYKIIFQELEYSDRI